MKKIVIIGPGLTMGGMEQASANLANALQMLNIDITYISIFNHNKFFTLKSDIKFLEPTTFNLYKLNFFKTLFWIRQNIRKTKPEAVIVFNKFYSALILLALAGCRQKIFISERSSPTFKWSYSISVFNKIVFSCIKPTGIIAQTKIAADYQKSYYGARIPIKVIHNIVRPIALYPQQQRKRQILAVGRLRDHLKGFDRLLEAFATIQNQDWELVFAGGDAEGELIKKQAQSLGISNRIKFLGKIKEMDKVYAEASIFVIPSRSEGFPNALCEAMASGLSCISFDFIAGPREIITHNVDGIIVEDSNIKALANAIDWLIANEVERMRLGINAMQIRERLSMEKIGKEYIDFIFIDGYGK